MNIEEQNTIQIKKKRCRKIIYLLLFLAAVAIVAGIIFFLIINNKQYAKQEYSSAEEYVAEEGDQMEPRNAKAVIGNLFEIVRPARTPLVINCKNLNKTFDFQWNTNAESVEVTLKDKKGRILLTQEVSQTGLQLRYEDYYKYLQVFWEMKAVFEDGTTEEKKGVLQLLVDD